MPPKPRITHSQVKELVEVHGLSLTAAAEALGVSKSLASYHLHNSGGGYVNPWKEARKSMPWKEIQPEHRDSGQARRAAWHAEYIATGGKHMSEKKLRYLRQWYQRLANDGLVVVYDPTIPPHKGAKTGGWDYVPREEKDGDLLFRENEYTEVTDETRVDWRLPDKEFWPQE
ncbi:Hypothetical protein AJAP_27980 [Amycolatopsis japonica]|uniref:Immunity repressor n=1 Tax=Amycolatopsis japonica TaxID=208439 RepID=A0A075V695_9PSEU|nr:hypothetical protein [Amycolatopsis japonica]AIG78435.1 Hypothetical protein AJAP_27980 [Amycolatopsis japonica]